MTSPTPPRCILVTGSTGFIGRHLLARLRARGDQVIGLRRGERPPPGKHIDAVVNLAGAPILGLPWTAARRRQLLSSRLDTTRALIQALADDGQHPPVFVSASAIGYYGVRGDEPLDEQAAPQPIFQSRLCREWEEVACTAEGLGSRVVRLRLGVVLGRDGGALPQLALPVRLGLGAILGSGRQGAPWIHIEDVVRLIEFALDQPQLAGAVNAVAPGHVTHAQMQRTLARVLHRPLWLRVPAFVLRAALGEMAQLLVDGQHVVPARALAAGFTFAHPQLEPALQGLLRQA